MKIVAKIYSIIKAHSFIDLPMEVCSIRNLPKQVDVVLLLKTRHPCNQYYPILTKLISHVYTLVYIHVISIINSAR